MILASPNFKKNGDDKDYKDAHNLRFMTKFVKMDSPALIDILDHFKENGSRNKINRYIREIGKNGDGKNGDASN